MPITHRYVSTAPPVSDKVGSEQWNDTHDVSGLLLSEIGITQGLATLDFSTGENEATVAVTGQTDITADAKVKAWIMADDTTADHTANDHRFFNGIAFNQAMMQVNNNLLLANNNLLNVVSEIKQTAEVVQQKPTMDADKKAALLLRLAEGKERKRKEEEAKKKEMQKRMANVRKGKK